MSVIVLLVVAVIAAFSWLENKVSYLHNEVNDLITKDIVYSTHGSHAFKTDAATSPGCAISCKYTSLVGATGAIGATGSQGVQGAQGPQGLIPGYSIATNYGCIGDGVTDNTACFNAWFNAIVSTQNVIGYIPPGNYVVKSSLTWDISKANGGIIQGAGVRNTWLTFQLPANTPNALLINTAANGVAYYWALRDIAITSAATYGTLTFGRNSTFNYPDYIYNFNLLNVAVVNTNNALGSQPAAVTINGLFASQLNIYANASTTSSGTGIKYSNGGSNLITGSIYNAYQGIYLTGTSVKSSTFQTSDIELVSVSLVIDNAGVQKNVFSGGYWVGGSSTGVVQATAGTNNMIQNVFLQPATGTSPTFSGMTGLHVSVAGGCTAPSTFTYAAAAGTTIPASGTAVANPVPCKALLWISGAGWLNTLTIGGLTYTNPGNSYGGQYTVQPGDSVTITYTKSTGMQYRWSWGD